CRERSSSPTIKVLIDIGSSPFRPHWLEMKWNFDDRNRPAVAGIARFQTSVLAVETVQALADVGQTEAARLARRWQRKAGTVVGHFQAQIAARNARPNLNRPGTWRQAVLNAVLHQRLQHHARYQRAGYFAIDL